jgi:hypothetical protein
VEHLTGNGPINVSSSWHLEKVLPYLILKHANEIDHGNSRAKTLEIDYSKVADILTGDTFTQNDFLKKIKANIKAVPRIIEVSIRKAKEIFNEEEQHRLRQGSRPPSSVSGRSAASTQRGSSVGPASRGGKSAPFGRSSSVAQSIGPSDNSGPPLMSMHRSN